MVSVNSEELNFILSRDEGPDLDFKRANLLTNPNRENRNKIARQLVAFANRGGGQIVFGIDDDSREPEGVEIFEEDAADTISEIARDKCSPPVSFNYQFFSESEGDLESGSIFVLKIEGSDTIPTAFVEHTGREIKKREYRLRTGDESRLVTDSELRQMFSDDLEPGFDNNIISWYFYKTNDPAPGHPIDHPVREPRVPMSASSSQIMLSEYMCFITENDEEWTMMDSTHGLQNIVFPIFPLAFLNYLSDIFEHTWDIEWDNNTHQVKSHEDLNRTPTERISIDRTNINYEDNPLLKKVEFDWYNLFLDYGNSFVVPKGTKIDVDLSGYFSRIKFSLDKKFEIIVSLNGYEPKDLPREHPYSGRYYTEADLSGEAKEEWRTIEFDIKCSTEFGFPDEPNPDIEEHRKFAESINDTLIHLWSADSALDGTPDRLSYEIDSKLDYLLDSLD